MSATSSVTKNPAGVTLRPAVPASQPLLIALAVTAVVTMFRLTGTVDSDVAWQLWIAGRIHAGANLYTDIVETNPPLWFWMALPVDRLACFTCGSKPSWFSESAAWSRFRLPRPIGSSGISDRGAAACCSPMRRSR
jgi:hypothetical protein